MTVLPPPCAVSLAARHMGITMRQQSEAAGIPYASLLHRRSDLDWKKWKVDTAERWCRAIGFKFIALSGNEVLTRIPWNHRNKRHHRVLVSLFRAAGIEKPTERQIADMIRVLRNPQKQVAVRNNGARKSPHAGPSKE